MKTFKLCLGIAFAVIFSASCTSVSTSKNTGESLSSGYTSARLAKPGADLQDAGAEGSAEVHDTIQRTIRNRFKTRGMIFGNPNADLVVAYMIVGQGAGTPTMNEPYSGNGGNPNNFKSGTLVIDIVDAKTNKLIYRGTTKRSLLGGVKPVERNARINETVAQTLTPFFN